MRTPTIYRRDMLTGFAGLVLGTTVSGILSGVNGSANPSPAGPWSPRRLDPMECAQTAYRGYWEENGGCGFAVFKGIIGMMGIKYGMPYESFPLWMMSYAAGGIACWGTVCGALNCAAAAYGLFYDQKEQQPLVDALFSWYEMAELPQFIPDSPMVAMDVKRTVTTSVLCHVALSRWSYETGHKISTKERCERCSRVVADVTKRAVEILNDKIVREAPSAALSSPQQYCSKCHSRGKDADCSRTKMHCGFCHQGSLGNKFVNHPE